MMRVAGSVSSALAPRGPGGSALVRAQPMVSEVKRFVFCIDRAACATMGERKYQAAIPEKANELLNEAVADLYAVALCRHEASNEQQLELLLDTVKRRVMEFSRRRLSARERSNGWPTRAELPRWQGCGLRACLAGRPLM
jgi:hypothetical protein